jgi:superfamily II DNA or RNA helicase
MSLKSIKYKSYYSKSNGDNVAKDFYIPSLSCSKRYDRATGYFGSTIYILAWSALKEFVDNGGRMRIICSPYLSEKDQDAIEEGYSMKQANSVQIINDELRDIFGKNSLSAPERVLACLISLGIIEIKIAIGKEDINRLFHDKVGIFYDGMDSVAFRGSINETYKGLSNDGNFESLDVFTSWSENNDLERLNGISNDFQTIWEGKNSLIKAIDIPDDIKGLIKEHARKESAWTDAYEEILTSIDEGLFWSADKRENGKRPREHQLQSLKNWEQNNRRGIFEHATGSGKTFTAMCAIRKCIEENCPVLILVPSVGLLNQWKDELAETYCDIKISYLLCGGGYNTWKNEKMLESFTKPLKRENKRITLAVMDTAVTDAFMSRLVVSEKLLVVADEVHRMGSNRKRIFFKINAGYRLAMSATPKRYNDNEGTLAIIDYFGGILPPKYTLKNAVDDGVLCRYFYYPMVVTLTVNEQQEWDKLSKEISRQYAIATSSDCGMSAILNRKIQSLLIERSRIVKEAKNKTKLAVDILKLKYKNGQRWIVYCDNQQQLNDVLIALKGIGVKAYEYHSKLPDDVKKQTLLFFRQVGGVVVSIRCLDEGIDIPNTTHALILASSQNPREFIQRRGRILRKSDNKYHSFLYDDLVLPNNFAESDKHAKIVETEILRAIEFGEMSEDPKCIVDLKLIAIRNNIDFNEINNGFEND